MPRSSQTASVVSVIIATRNYASYLPEAVGSLTAQTFTRWDCVIVDDGSTDDTDRVAAELAAGDPRVRYLAQPARGVSAARNTGLRASKGRFVQFLDADDWLAPGKLEHQARSLTANPDIDVIYGSERPVLGNAHSPAPLLQEPRPSGSGDELVSELLASNPMVMSAPLFRRSVLDRVQGFDETLTLNEDWDLLLRIALSGARFRFDPAIASLAYVRLHPGSASANRLRMIEGVIELHHRMEPKLSNPAHHLISERLIADMTGAAGTLRVRDGDVKRGLGEILQAARSRPRPKWFAALAFEPLRLLVSTAARTVRARRTHGR